MKKFILFLFIVVVGVGGAYYWQESQKVTETKRPQITTAKAEYGPILLSVSTTGRVVSAFDVDIKCKASGEIMALPYDVSDEVKKGELLVELDPVDEQRMVKQAEVSLLASEARLTQTRLNLAIAEKNLVTDKKRAETALKAAGVKAEDALAKAERLKHLLAQKLTGQEESDAAQVAAIQATAELKNAQVRMEELETQRLALGIKKQDVDLAQAQVESDRIALSLAQQRLKDTKVMAPIDGIVTTRNVQIGQIISSGISNVGGGTTVLTLSDLSRLFILAAVDESDIGKVGSDQPVIITADAFPGRRFRGKVVRIATKGVNSYNVVTFEVKIEVLGENKSLFRPEMTANIEIISAQKERALLIPTEAVYRKKGKHFTQLLKQDGTTEEREVEVGIGNDTKFEIVSGLTEGETVVIRKNEADSRWRQPQRGPGMRMILGGGRRQ